MAKRRVGKTIAALEKFPTGITGLDEITEGGRPTLVRGGAGWGKTLPAMEFIDIYLQSTLAKGEQIIAAPTLIKKLPVPLRKFIGNLADKERILVGLDLRPKE